MTSSQTPSVDAPGQRIVDSNALLERKVWVLLTYSDKSEFCFQTTLNEDILREEGVTLEEGKLVRLDKKYYWGGKFIYRQFSFEEATVSLWDALTYTDPRSARLHVFL